MLSEANMLNKQQRFAEAYEKLEQGLAQIPAINTPARAKTMVNSDWPHSMSGNLKTPFGGAKKR